LPRTRYISSTADFAVFFGAMAKADEINFRMAVGTPDGPHSAVWRGFSTKNEVYLCYQGMGGIEKISLHNSRICRHAFTDVEGPADGESDRVIDKWTRSPTPERGPAYALVARIPTDFLSTAAKPEHKKIAWIPAAPAGGVTYLEFLYTKRVRKKLRIRK
jgi:hypothetical protein